MITQKIKALFQFIEFLHSNIENFNQYNGLIKERESLNKVCSNLKPEQNYKDKLQYDKVQAEIESKFKILQDNTANLIKAKAKKLNVCSFENEPIYNFNGIESEIRQLKKNFNDKDLPEIFKHKSKYLKYRSQTHKTFLSMGFFFNELDEITKSLFDYFKDTDENEFEEFEQKTVKVNSIEEIAEQIAEQIAKENTNLKYELNTKKEVQVNTPLLKTSPPQPINKDQSRTKQVIAEAFENMDIRGWKYAFRTEQDYNLFTDLLTNFFEDKDDYSIPENTIRLKRGCKTRLAATLGKIHSELSNVDKFSSDTDYFEIVKCLSHYTTLSNNELYKSLTRYGKDY